MSDKDVEPRINFKHKQFDNVINVQWNFDRKIIFDFMANKNFVLEFTIIHFTVIDFQNDFENNAVFNQFTSARILSFQRNAGHNVPKLTQDSLIFLDNASFNSFCWKKLLPDEAN